MKNKLYLVKYCGGDIDDYYRVTIFVTSKRKTAIDYTKKFNRILREWKRYYKQFEEKNVFGYPSLKEEYFNDYYDRWSRLHMITKCYYEIIELR